MNQTFTYVRILFCGLTQLSIGQVLQLSENIVLDNWEIPDAEFCIWRHADYQTGKPKNADHEWQRHRHANLSAVTHTIAERRLDQWVEIMQRWGSLTIFGTYGTTIVIV